MSRIELTETEHEQGAWVITVAGELDLAVAGELGAAIERASRHVAVLIDLEPCEFIDSTGIALLLAAHNGLREEGRRLAVVGPSGQVMKVLELTGLRENGLVFVSAEDAIEER